MKLLKTKVRDNIAEQSFGDPSMGSNPTAELTFSYGPNPTHRLCFSKNSDFWASIAITKFGKRAQTITVSTFDRKQLLELASNLVSIANTMVYEGSESLEYFADVKLDHTSTGDIFVDGYFAGVESSVTVAVVKASGEVTVGVDSREEYLSSPKVVEALEKALSRNAQLFG